MSNREIRERERTGCRRPELPNSSRAGKEAEEEREVGLVKATSIQFDDSWRYRKRIRQYKACKLDRGAMRCLSGVGPLPGRSRKGPFCAKLHHQNIKRCISCHSETASSSERAHPAVDNQLASLS